MTPTRASHGGGQQKRTLWISLNVVYAAVLVGLAMTPAVPSSAARVPDVVAHALAYGVQCCLLFALINLYLPMYRALVAAGGGAVCFGVFTEWLQMLQHTVSEAQRLGMGVDMTDVRVVNNVACCMYEDSGGSAAISGSGTNFKVLGNHVHNNGGSKLYHALYFDARARVSGDVEIAYNHIHHQTGGRGIQIYGDTGRLITNVRVHHNFIHHVPLDAILFGRDSGAGFAVYNNVVYHTSDASLRGPSKDFGVSGGCLRFNSPKLEALVYNNTFVDCAVDNHIESGGIRFQEAQSITLRNNILVGKYYVDAENRFDYPGHTIGNLRASFRATQSLELILRLNNVTDRYIADRADYAFGDFRYFPGRGREMFAEIRYAPQE